MASETGYPVGDAIAEDMRKLTPELRRKLRPALRRAGAVVAADAQRRAAAWSARIPPTVKVSTSFQANKEGVFVRAGGPTAPHARLYENVWGRSEFRHPVYAVSGRPTVWVSQQTRPFLAPAARANEQATTNAITAAIDEVGPALGFH